jgi:membrane-anchored protein YejM (alkaline phosphatase superfamily)
VINAAILLVGSLLFIASSDVKWSFHALTFGSLAATAQIWFVCTVAFLLAAPLGKIWRAQKSAGFLLGLFFTAAILFTVVDLRVWRIFRFHLNSLLINVIVTPGGLQTLDINPVEVCAAAFAAVACMAFQVILFRGLQVSMPSVNRSQAWWVHRFQAVLFIGGFLCAVTERSLYAIADLRNDTEVLVAARQIPLYQPTTIKKLAKKYFGKSLTQEDLRLTKIANGSALKYPHQLPEITEKKSGRLNIVWIILDCLRSEAFNPQNTPKIWEFAKNSQVFAQHISGGNNTRMGIFGMFYGLNGTYWNAILAERRSPALIESLARRGYQFYITASAPLTFPEFRHTAFVNIQDAVHDSFTGIYANDKDGQQVAKFKEFVSSAGKKAPFFSMLLLDSTHSPYSYPKNHAVFLPHTPGRYYADPSETKALSIVKNRYNNSVHFADEIVGDIINNLQKEGILENSIVLVTGDHGEEFYEHGYFGHFTSFSPEQTHVPMIMYVPGLPAHEYQHRTSHLDLPATTLSLLGSKNNPADYTLGRNMFDEAHPRTFAMSCGWDQCAIIDNQGWLVFGTEPYNASIMEAFDSEYRPLRSGQEQSLSRKNEIFEVLNQNRAFAL